MRKLITILFILIYLNGYSTDYFVSSTFGNDANTGLSEVQAWQTIFEFTEGQVNMLWNTLEFCKGSIQTSQSPANDVKNVTKMIDSLQQIIRVQYIAQLKDTIKK